MIQRKRFSKEMREKIVLELAADARAIAEHFDLQVVGIDYMAGEGGMFHLLEVNHIPNVTVFPFMRSAFLDLAAEWVAN
jgi:D-alanine-D-alanine ligase-like ATP-grasp enzyme